MVRILKKQIESSTDFRDTHLFFLNLTAIGTYSAVPPFALLCSRMLGVHHGSEIKTAEIAAKQIKPGIVHQRILVVQQVFARGPLLGSVAEHGLAGGAAEVKAVRKGVVVGRIFVIETSAAAKNAEA
jgi:hypothetical protein